MAAYTRCLRCAGAPRRPPGVRSSFRSRTSMPTWPSPRSERLGTPDPPAIRFARGTYFGASWFTHLLQPVRLLAPLYGSDRNAQPPGAFTSRLSTDRSPSPLLGMTTTATRLAPTTAYPSSLARQSGCSSEPRGTWPLSLRRVRTLRQRLALLAGLAPAGMAASLAAPDLYMQLSRIRLLPRVRDGEAPIGPGMKDTRLWEPVVNQAVHPSPGELGHVAASGENPSPALGDVGPEHRECAKVGRHRVVV